MAYRRSISTRFTLLARERFTPSIPLIHRDDNDHKSHQKDRNFNTLHQHQSFGSRINTFAGFNTSFQDQRWSQFSISPMLGSVLGRHMSTAVGEGADKIEYMADVAEVLADKTAEVVASAAPAVNEVAIAAADSAFPVAALQYLIDNVHSFTGFEWWASIVVTTLLIRGATIPLLINQLKSTTKLSLLRPQLEEIKQEMQDRGMEPKAVAEGQQRMQALFKEYGVTPFTPLKGLLFQGPVFVSFFLAISNMVEKVPSFKHGGAYWFTDLTTPDSMYIFPVLTALSFWITVECNMQEGMEGNPAAKTMKNVSRVFAIVTVPLTMTFPKAIFCYWITSNLFSLTYGLVLKVPGVKKFLGVPQIPVGPPPLTAEEKPAFSFFETLKKFAEAQKVNSSAIEGSKTTVNPRISSSSVTSQRLRSLEKQVKGRKKNKKR
ncbi:Mitochondrial inner membrane protein OXA1 [Camellia lanceoleosa]|uniref:Mitochondrial inner membrane protein OXA1 n=1 Tax=Camellia lanceoleosa TaxID=1840588 RepID=A0ACC0G319_9ERIC|nr:Mitochondrial inner membrane protein OXA1 [Camellia lanceoleosa]